MCSALKQKSSPLLVTNALKFAVLLLLLTNPFLIKKSIALTDTL